MKIKRLIIWNKSLDSTGTGKNTFLKIKAGSGLAVKLCLIVFEWFLLIVLFTNEDESLNIYNLCSSDSISVE